MRRTPQTNIKAAKTGLAAIFAVMVLAGTNGNAASLVIDSVQSQTVGSTAVITGSGNFTNTNFWNAGVVGEFLVKDISNILYGLRVSATNPTGQLTSGTDSLMVARTVDSQGLTDGGTLSVYVRMTGNNTAPDAPNSKAPAPWTLDLNFSFFDATPDGGGGYTFTTPHTLTLLLTSLDIDYKQRYYTANSTFDSNSTYLPTNITAAPAISGFSGFTADGNSVFNNPAHAVSSKGTGSSFDVRLEHNDVALFMFEFRDPSSIVPEPGTATLTALAGLVLAGWIRRRVS